MKYEEVVINCWVQWAETRQHSMSGAFDGALKMPSISISLLNN